MLLINGVIALLGMVITYVIYQTAVHCDLRGGEVILLSGFGLWLFLFMSDVIENKLIEMFNKEGP